MRRIRDFHKLGEVLTLASIAEPSSLEPVPDSAVVIITDVKASTRAVESGRYRDVNLVGASSVMALKNALKYPSLPFIFGGDGATFLIDSADRDRAAQALRAVRSLAVESFGLELRVGMVDVSELRRAGGVLMWGRSRVSEHLSLPIFHGSGFDLAESWIKGGEEYCENAYENPQLAPVEGLECRWQPLQSKRGSYVSVIVRFLKPSPSLFENLSKLLSQDLGPVPMEQLHLQSNPFGLLGEARVHRKGSSFWGLLRHWLSLMTQVAYGFFAFSSRGPESWSRYKNELTQNTDTLKYDNNLRFVADLSDEKRMALRQLLDDEQDIGNCVYGWHESSTAMMTCLVSSREGDHVHLMDGGDGGYTRAAQQLKQEWKARSAATRSPV